MGRKLQKKKLGEEKQVVVHIHQEIIIYVILPWVPLKSLFRFKSASKAWNKIISEDPVFITSQSLRCLTFPPAIMCWIPHELSFLSLHNRKLVSLMPDKLLWYIRRQRFIITSSNGLLCGVAGGEGGPYFYVTNLVTMETVYINNPDKKTEDDPICFWFNPWSCNPYYVVAYAFIITGNSSSVLDIGFKYYTSKTGKWSISNAKAQISKSRGYLKDWGSIRSRSVSANDTLYWKLGKDIVWFDTKEDRAGVVATPVAVPYSEMGECNDKLSYISIIDSKDIVIWFLTELEWVKKYSLNLINVYEENLKIVSRYYRTMDVWNQSAVVPLPFEGGDCVLFWVKHGKRIVDKGIVFEYNLNTGIVQLIRDTYLRKDNVPLTSHKSSLVSPHLSIVESLEL